MLRISKLADYAILIMHYLVGSENQLLSANDIADSVKISPPTVKKILKLLCEAGLLCSVRGAEGGYGLAKTATSICLTSIITAIEGAPSLTECSAIPEVCTHSKGCSVKHNWQVINQFVSFTLNKITLADMAMPLSLSTLKHKLGDSH